MAELILRTVEDRDIPDLYHLMIQYIVDFYKKPKPEEAELKNLIQRS